MIAADLLARGAGVEEAAEGTGADPRIVARAHRALVAVGLAYSPCGLLQERVGGDPWRMLVACLLLNKTQGRQARPAFWELVRRWPGARWLAEADGRSLGAVLRPLGLWRRRASLLRAMSLVYDAGAWADPRELPGVGPYAHDSWRLFVEGDLAVRPRDGRLAAYVAWARRTRDLRRGHDMYKTFVNLMRNERCLRTYLKTRGTSSR